VKKHPADRGKTDDDRGRDRVRKADLYLRSGVPYYWIVDPADRTIEAFEASHMRGALALPLEGRLTWLDQYEKTVAILLKTRKPVVAYCA